jgi:carbonic anhydrase/acetyltransferase-like protein (isoleucine patch superfamily)
MAVFQLDAHVPQIADTAWIADNAQVMGEVQMGAHSSVWFSSVVRGDSDKITIGEGSNIQDGSVLHADVGMPLNIGNHVSVGHMVQLHGCTIGDESLIGIGAIVLNGVTVGADALVAAGAVVTKDVPAAAVVMGTPAQVKRQQSPAEISAQRAHARSYRQLAEKHAANN